MNGFRCKLDTIAAQRDDHLKAEKGSEHAIAREFDIRVPFANQKLKLN